MTAQPEKERDDCTDCFALPVPDNIRVISARTSGESSEIWHTPDCPAFAIEQINAQEGAKLVKEQDTWAAGVFPAAHERLRQAAADMPLNSAARPFIDALTELVQARANATGLVALRQWAEILERHFPPELPDLDHTTD